jgi:hypothetical protein
LALDSSGDQFVADWIGTEDHRLDAKPLGGVMKLTSGHRQKRAGICGSASYEDDINEFNPPADGTYVVYVCYEISYKDHSLLLWACSPNKQRQFFRGIG